MYPFSEYKLIRFERGSFPKKYNAVLRHNETGREVRVPFGDRRYSHYRDGTPLKLYKHLDHLDPGRRRLYRQRHAGDNLEEFSPGYFSMKYLWT